jgi:hypothetical protein
MTRSQKLTWVVTKNYTAPAVFYAYFSRGFCEKRCCRRIAGNTSAFLAFIGDKPHPISREVHPIDPKKEAIVLFGARSKPGYPFFHAQPIYLSLKPDWLLD